MTPFKTAENAHHKHRPNKDLTTMIIEGRYLNYWKGSEQTTGWGEVMAPGWDKGEVDPPRNI